jgi:hypothetical protein
MMFKAGGEGEGEWRAQLVDFDWTCRQSEVPTDAEYFWGRATPSRLVSLRLTGRIE